LPTIIDSDIQETDASNWFQNWLDRKKPNWPPFFYIYMCDLTLSGGTVFFLNYEDIF
jgi:hypothetical protein